jgi:hypothetical protein
MLDKITTALIAVVIAAIMTWCFFSPFLVPQRYFHAYRSTEASTGTAPLAFVIRQHKFSPNETAIRFVY